MSIHTCVDAAQPRRSAPAMVPRDAVKKKSPTQSAHTSSVPTNFFTCFSRRACRMYQILPELQLLEVSVSAGTEDSPQRIRNDLTRGSRAANEKADHVLV